MVMGWVSCVAMDVNGTYAQRVISGPGYCLSSVEDEACHLFPAEG